MDFEQASKVIGKTQRNWDYTVPIPREDVDHLIKVSSNAPMKQGMQSYRLFVSTRLEFNQLIYKWAHDQHDNGPIQNRIRNSQVAAPLLMLYAVHDIGDVINSPKNKEKILELNIEYEVEKDHQGNILRYNPLASVPDFCFSAGVAAGATAMASAELGYQTGFCSCMNIPGLVDEINNKFPGVAMKAFWNEYNIMDVLCLGIGRKNPNFQSNQVIQDGKVLTTIASTNRKRPTTYIYK